MRKVTGMSITIRVDRVNQDRHEHLRDFAAEVGCFRVSGAEVRRH